MLSKMSAEAAEKAALTGDKKSFLIEPKSGVSIEKVAQILTKQGAEAVSVLNCGWVSAVLTPTQVAELHEIAIPHEKLVKKLH